MKLDELRKRLRTHEERAKPEPKPEPEPVPKVKPWPSYGGVDTFDYQHCDCCGQMPSISLSGNWFCGECTGRMKRRASTAANLCDLCLSSAVVHHHGTRPFPLLCDTCRALDWEGDHE